MTSIAAVPLAASWASAAYTNVNAAYSAQAVEYAVYVASSHGFESSIINKLVAELGCLTPDTNPFDYLSMPCVPVDEMYSFHHEFIFALHDIGMGFDYWAQWYESRVFGGKNEADEASQILGVSEAMLSQNPSKINAYLKSVQHDLSAIPLNRIRAIFVGHGGAGKTSVISRLQGKEVIEGEGEMTPGIEISDWKVPGSEMVASLWDFGGQVIAHATHQFFFRERCVYVIVVDGRAGLSCNEQAEYWLEYVRAYGVSAPTLVVGNKADQIHVHLDMHRLKSVYSGVVGYYQLSCAKLDQFRPEFDAFVRDFTIQLLGAGTRQIRLPVAHAKVLDDLRKRSSRESLMDKSSYEDLCEKHGVSSGGDLNRSWLLDLLDKLGIVVCFPDFGWLGRYVLNPRWLTYGVYALLFYGGKRAKLGVLSERDVAEILQSIEVTDELGNILSYSTEKSRFIIDAMDQFKLCYRNPREISSEGFDLITVPELLPSDRPAKLNFDKGHSVVFDFDFEGMLPRHIMPSLIAHRSSEIHLNKVWRYGVCLASSSFDAAAIVQADYHRRRLSIWVSGRQASRYFYVLHDQVCQMLKQMPNLFFDEWVGLTKGDGDPRHRASFRDLLALEAAGERTYICRYGVFDVFELLGIMPPDRRAEQNVEFGLDSRFPTHIGRLANDAEYASGDAPQVFVSYSRKDFEFKERLLEALAPLKRNGVIGVLYDQDVSAGRDWDDEIHKMIDSAEIFVMLVSPSFMASDYIIGIEMKRAMTRHKAGRARVLPVLVRPDPSWLDSPLGRLQSLPSDGKSLAEWPNIDQAWVDVVKGIKRVVDELGSALVGDNY